jgi:hypothetical protein
MQLKERATCFDRLWFSIGPEDDHRRSKHVALSFNCSILYMVCMTGNKNLLYVLIETHRDDNCNICKSRDLRLLEKKYVGRDVGESGRGFIRGIILAFSLR